MRRGPMLVMCAATGLVVVTNLRSGAGTATSAAGVQPIGVLLQPPASTPVPAPAAPAHRAAATPRPARTASHARPRASSKAASRTSPTSLPHRVTTPRTAAPRPAPKPSPTAARPTTVVVNGQGVDTQYGVVQVQITISQHRIVKAEAIAYPHGNGQTDQINAYAIPQLDQETLQAQSAHIDTVSGATYTSGGYRSSLQSALDAAHAAGVW